MADSFEAPSAVPVCGPAPQSVERQSLKLCLSSKAKPGSWTVSPPKPKTESPVSEAGDIRWPQDHSAGNTITKQSGNLPGLETSPCQPQPCKYNISSRGCASPSKSSDTGQISTESEDDHDGYYEQTEMNAVVTSLDHSGTSPRIRIEMSPRAGRFSPRVGGSYSPRISGGISPRVSSRGLSPHATRFARVSASSPTSVKIVFMKNELKNDGSEIPGVLTSPFKKPRGAASPRALVPSQTTNGHSTDAQPSGQNIPSNGQNTDVQSARESKNDITCIKMEIQDRDSTEPLLKPLKISPKDFSRIKTGERQSLTRSESGDSDELPRLEKVVPVKASKSGRKKTAGSESSDDAIGDFDEMPDDLSRHSSVDRYSGRNDSGTPVYDSHSLSSTSPPPLDRMSSGESEGPPPLAKMCCPGSQCHKSLGALGIHCLGSPKDTGVSPQYLECGGAREEAASIGEGSPPSDVEHANKVNDMAQFMLGNSSPPIPSPSDQEGCQKTQTVVEPEPCDSRPQTITPSPQQPPIANDTGDGSRGGGSGKTKPVSSFLGEFAKFVESTSGTEVADQESQSFKGNHSLNTEHLEQSKTSDELTADDTESVDDKYNLRPKKRKAEHSMCECCVHLPSCKKLKTINSHRFHEQMRKVLQLRHRVCILFQTVFPELQYPERFYEDTHIVEQVMDQIIEAAKENEDCRSSPEGASSRVSVNWDPQVVLCKSPRKCLLALRHHICRMLLALLPTLQLDEDFDRSGRCVDRLLDDVIYLNSENR